MSISDHRLPLRMETPRLILRPYVADDASWYYAMSLRNREHLRRYESGNVAMSLTDEAHTRETLTALAAYWNAGTCYFVGVFDKALDTFVAQLYVGPFREKPIDYIVGYMADCEHEGRGFVTEAVTETVASIFDHLHADQVRIHCDQSNVRSRRVAERCGFHLERVFEEEKMGPEGVLQPCLTAVYLRHRNDGRQQRMPEA